MIGIQSSERNGPLVGAVQVFSGDEVMLISNGGTLVRTKTDEIAVSGRNTQGVRVIRLKKDEELIAVERVAESDDVEDAEAASDTEDANSQSNVAAPADENSGDDQE